MPALVLRHQAPALTQQIIAAFMDAANATGSGCPHGKSGFDV